MVSERKKTRYQTGSRQNGGMLPRGWRTKYQGKAREGYVSAEISIQFLPQERKHVNESRSGKGSRFWNFYERRERGLSVRNGVKGVLLSLGEPRNFRTPRFSLLKYLLAHSGVATEHGNRIHAAIIFWNCFRLSFAELYRPGLEIYYSKRRWKIAASDGSF